MPIYQLEDILEEFVTPKHSTAYGRLITGTFWFFLVARDIF
jgi:hypothetical protein